MNQPVSSIEPTAFKPSSDEGGGRRLRPHHYVIGALALLAGYFAWFLFTSKSVQLVFDVPAQNVSVQGGFSLELGGVWLLRQGQYEIAAEADLYHPLVTTIEVGSERNQRVELQFVPLPGYLTVNTQPEDAEVRLLGDATSKQNLELSAGEHELTISHPRYIAETRTVEMTGLLKEQSISVTLAPNWSDVSVASMPAGATVFIDGEAWPQTTPTVIEALAGEREITIQQPGYKIHRQRIFAQAGMAQELDPVRLIQADAQILVRSEPSGAGVIVNGQFMGETPLQLDLSSSQRQRLNVVLSGHDEYQETLSLSRGDSVERFVRLRQQTGELSILVEPAIATVTVDGNVIGQGSQTLDLPIRSHDVQIELAGYAGYRKTITPKHGLTQELRVRLLTHEAARLAALKKTITAPDGQNLKLFEPSDFQMGASRREPGRRANETLRPVRMDRLFYLATHETTNAQFRKFASGHDSGKYVDSSLNQDDQPVANLSWHDAAAYCNWLSDQAGLEPFYQVEFGKVIGMNWQAKGFRLPTEAEWTWAARVLDDGSTLRFPWGNNMPPPDRHGNYADRAASALVGRVIFGYNDNYAASSPIGTYKPNRLGLFDVAGNVAEWMNDYYEIPDQSEVHNPTGPKSGEYHVIKGSSWMHGTITELRYSFRDYGIEGREDIGFRIARTAE